MKRLLLTAPKRKGHATSWRVTQGSTRASREAEEQQENVGKSLYCGFLRKGRQGRVSRLDKFRID